MNEQRKWYIKVMRKGLQSYKRSKSYVDFRYTCGSLEMALCTDIINGDEYEKTFEAMQKLYYKGERK